jgi:hypothetical protein
VLTRFDCGTQCASCYFAKEPCSRIGTAFAILDSTHHHAADMPESDSSALYSAILIAVQVLAIGGAAWLLLFPEHVHGRGKPRASGIKAAPSKRDQRPGGIDWGQGAKGNSPERH